MSKHFFQVVSKMGFNGTTYGVVRIEDCTGNGPLLCITRVIGDFFVQCHFKVGPKYFKEHATTFAQPRGSSVGSVRASKNRLLGGPGSNPPQGGITTSR